METTGSLTQLLLASKQDGTTKKHMKGFLPVPLYLMLEALKQKTFHKDLRNTT